MKPFEKLNVKELQALLIKNEFASNEDWKRTYKRWRALKK